MIRLTDIEAEFDVSDIHPYVINRKDIVFLHKKQAEKSNVSRANANHKYCEICGYELDSSKASMADKRFCSIACKVEVRRI